MEHSVTEVAEDDHVRGVLVDGLDDLPPQPVRHEVVVDPVDLEHPMTIGDEPLLEGVGRLPSTSARVLTPVAARSSTTKARSSSSPGQW